MIQKWRCLVVFFYILEPSTYILAHQKSTYSQFSCDTRLVWLTNNRSQPWNVIERMNCLPDDRNELWIEPKGLLKFTLNDYMYQG